MTLGQEEVDIILAYPLKPRPDLLRQEHHDALNSEDPVQKVVVVEVLSALEGYTENVLSPRGSSDLEETLFTTRRNVKAGIVGLGHFEPLIHHVIDESSDNIIWTTVFDLINVLGPRSFTPQRHSYPKLSRRETAQLLRLPARLQPHYPTARPPRTLREISCAKLRNASFAMLGSCDKYFNPTNWRREQLEMLDALRAQHDGTTWSEFPSSADEQNVWTWLRSLEEHALVKAPHKLHTTQTPHQFEGGKTQIDIFFQTQAKKATELYKYKHALVVGEQKKSYERSHFKPDILQLTRYVRAAALSMRSLNAGL